MLEKVGKRQAIDREQLHERLRGWEVAAGDEDVIGDVTRNQGRTAWIWVRVGDSRYRLHADTTRAGVRRYLALLNEHGEALAWTVVLSERGRHTKVAFCPEREVIPGFFLYLPEK